MPIDSATREILELLVEKAHKLQSFNFEDHVRDKGSGFHARRDSDGDWQIEFDIPDEEKKDAFLLTFRMFFQQGDDISFIGLKPLLGNPTLSNNWKSRVAGLRKDYLSYINGQPDQVEGEIFDGNPTRSEILAAVLYGDAGHAKSGSTERTNFKKWTATDIQAGILQEVSTTILIQVLGFITALADVTEQELK